MRVFHSTMAKVKDGNLEGAVGVAGEAAKLVGSHGAEVRFFVAGVAGEEVNSTLFSMEFDSPEALGKTFDSLADSTELQALMTRLNGPKSPSAVTSQSMGYEVPTGHNPKVGRGAVLEVHSMRIIPGRITEAISQAKEICEFVESNGAVNARLVQLSYAGIASGIAALTWEVDNMLANAHLGAAWFSDAGMALQAKSMTANPPSVPVASALWNEVPL